jgi:SAM-dependent methyltransferase
VFKNLIQRLAGTPASTPAAPGSVVAPATQAAARASILDQYVHDAPSPQIALDLFKGDWWSSFPGRWAHLQAGSTPLYDDPRIKWATQALGGVEGKRVLELGPLEGGHTYLLEAAGAREVVAIEASARAYLKCLIAKEVVGLTRSRFLFGDFEAYLRGEPERYDAIIACGVLYHLRDPVELIHNLARVTDRIYLWTQYFMRENVAAIPHMKDRFPGSHEAEYEGFRYTANRYEYGNFLDTTRFAGGSEEYSHWLSRDDLLGALRHAGFNEIVIHEDDLKHPNGPCISLAAIRK